MTRSGTDSASTSASACCTSCGGPRNHYVDGRLRPKCSDCNDRTARKSPFAPSFARRSSASVSVDPTPEAVALLRQIDELLEDRAYEWAEDTLTGIQSTVERTGKCTDGQRRAVQNIEDARTRRSGR